MTRPVAVVLDGVADARPMVSDCGHSFRTRDRHLVQLEQRLGGKITQDVRFSSRLSGNQNLKE